MMWRCKANMATQQVQYTHVMRVKTKNNIDAHAQWKVGLDFIGWCDLK